jgi:hypothetical protein
VLKRLVPLLLVILFAIFQLLCAKNDFITYRDKSLNYLISYPKRWYFSNEPGFMESMKNIAKRAIAERKATKWLDGLRLNFLLFRYQPATSVEFNPNVFLATQNQLKTLAIKDTMDYMLTIERALKAILKNYEYIEQPKIIDVNGKDFARLNFSLIVPYTYKIIKVQAFLYLYFDPINKRGYIFGATDLSKDFKRHKREFSSILNTIKIIQ